MGERDLFGTRAEYAVGAKAEQDGDPRLREAERRQVQLIPRCLDDLLPEDHRARAIWDVVGTLDLSRFYAAVAARGSQPGRPATDPKIWSRCGCTRRAKGLATRESWRDSASATMRTGGSAEASP